MLRILWKKFLQGINRAFREVADEQEDMILADQLVAQLWDDVFDDSTILRDALYFFGKFPKSTRLRYIFDNMEEARPHLLKQIEESLGK